MSSQRPLGEFLAARRAQLRPEDVGVRRPTDRRRVPGLRREELALAAGVSVSYYARLEQGQALHASPEVLDALAQALQLGEAERRHLHQLGSPGRRAAPRRLAPERVAPSLRQLLDAVPDVPALLIGRRRDVLAWNRLGHALFAGHLRADDPCTLARRPNLARLVFLDSHTRDLYEDWPAKARAAVGAVHLAAARYPNDPGLASLIGELTVKSPEFAAVWASHRVKTSETVTYAMRHPLVGRLEVTQQALHAEHGQHVLLATAPIGSPHHAALTLLAHSTTRDLVDPQPSAPPTPEPPPTYQLPQVLRQAIRFPPCP